MSQPQQEVTIADLAIDNLSRQVAVLTRDLALKDARVQQLESFIRANAEVLGLEVEGQSRVQEAPAEDSQVKQPRTNRVNGQASPKVSAKG